METTVRLKNTGLRGVPVADTRISFIDGHRGILIYRGYRIEDLAEKSSFAETAYLLLNGALPSREQLAGFSDQLKSAAGLPEFVLATLAHWPWKAHPMDVLQASVPLLAMADPELSLETREANNHRAIRILAGFPAVLAAWHRLRNGLQPVPPSSGLSHGGNFLWQLTGRQPDEELARALDVAMVLQAEHTFNASTFACREVVSTGAHMYAGAAAGVGALSGSLHGGANARVMELLLQMDAEGKTEIDVGQWVRGQLQRGKRIMGLGHAVYKTFDPRAVLLKKICRRLSGRKKAWERLYGLLATMEEVAVQEFERRGKPQIKANVDFYSGLLYFMMEIPPDLMTPLFAMSLACGWCAHMIEEKFGEAREKPAPYSPMADYIGEYCGLKGCNYLPLDQR